jgi:dihydrofolate reductase
MKTILIAAMDPNRVIGHKNRIPWHIPEEMTHFKKSTMGHGVIMGRKTFESIGKALPGRTNIVLSTNPNLELSGCHISHSLTEGMNYCSNQEKVFIIGGSTLYEQSMEHVDNILLSIIHREYAGDVFFPIIPANTFQLISEKEMGTEQTFTLQTYQRIPQSNHYS